MKLIHFSGIATGLVLILGILMVLPPYLQESQSTNPTLLSFSIVTDSNLPQWCHSLHDVLQQQNVKGIIFVSGVHASENPDCVKKLSNVIEIGSQSYHYSDISTISDYSLQLQEIKQGKETIDTIGGFDSKAFKAPYGGTDDNIYSILDRSKILVDFSPQNQYNKYHDGQYLWFEINSINVNQNNIQQIKKELSESKTIPVVLNLDNTIPTSNIDSLISALKPDVSFVSASDLVGYDLMGGSNAFN